MRGIKPPTQGTEDDAEMHPEPVPGPKGRTKRAAARDPLDDPPDDAEDAPRPAKRRGGVAEAQAPSRGVKRAPAERGGGTTERGFGTQLDTNTAVGGHVGVVGQVGVPLHIFTPLGVLTFLPTLPPRVWPLVALPRWRR